jgi:hypothetical protein
VTVSELTPAGTINVCSLPVDKNVHVTVEPDGEQFDGNATAEPAGATAHKPDNPAATKNTATRRRPRRDRSIRPCPQIPNDAFRSSIACLLTGEARHDSRSITSLDCEFHPRSSLPHPCNHGNHGDPQRLWACMHAPADARLPEQLHSNRRCDPIRTNRQASTPKFGRIGKTQ